MNKHQVSSRIKRAAGRLFCLALIPLLLLLSSPTPSHADTSVCGVITVNTTWTLVGNNYIVTCLVQVMQNVTLTIEPGVRVYFDPGTALRIDGELIARGVTFVSNKPTPAPGDWARIFFMSTSKDAVFDANGNYMSGSILKDSTVVYGGGGGFEGAVITYGASPFIDGNTIGYTPSRGIYTQGRSDSQKVVLKGNYVSHNTGGGIYVSAGRVISNTIQNNSASGQGGGIQAIGSEIIGNSVLDNTAGSNGGGIYAEGSTLTGNTVSGNRGGREPTTGTNAGGGIYSNGSDLTGNQVSGNSVSNAFDWNAIGGGIYAIGGTLSRNTVTGNVISGGSGKGGGIYSSLSTLTENVVNSNSVSSHNSSGGGIYCSGGSVINNSVSGNTASSAGVEISNGGGIYANGGTVANNTVRNNSAAGGADNLGGGIYGSLNTIGGNTLTGNSANRGGAIYSYKGTVNSNTVLANTTTMTGTVYIDQGTATLNTLRNNTAVYGGGLYGVSATLTGNTVEGNNANLGAGIYASNSTVRGNTLSSNVAVSDGGGIYANGGQVTQNTLTGNSVPSWGHGSGAYIFGTSNVTYNSVLTNIVTGGTSGGISISGQPVFQFNNLYGNQPYDAEIVSSQPVNGTLNYWGLSPCTAIPAQIYDGNDSPDRGQLMYAPSLYSPSPVAQLAVPQNLVLTPGQNSVTLNWSSVPPIPNVGCRVPGASAPDLFYRVYYDTDSACGPYDGKGLPAGDSPITVGTNTQINLSGASQDRYVFVVAAHDYLGRMSAYSNLVGHLSPEQKIFLPLITK